MLMDHKSLIHNQPSLKTIFSKPPMGFIFNEIKFQKIKCQLISIFYGDIRLLMFILYSEFYFRKIKSVL